MIAQATPDQTGSPKIVVAPKMVVSEVIKIGFILIRQAWIRDILTVFPRLRRIMTYSMSKIAFPTTIPASAITPIIEVAEKYSPWRR